MERTGKRVKVTRKGRHGNEVSESERDLDVQTQNMEYFFFFFMAFSFMARKTGKKKINRIITNGRLSVTRVKPDDCHVNGGEVHGPGVLILEVSATCSWEEKVIPFLCKSGRGLKTA